MTKSIVIISGKGGTGKTSLTASFALLAQSAVFADCDVEASDLHLLLSPTILQDNEFISGVLATIDSSRCDRCGKCIESCAFSAIDDTYVIDPVACEGCGVCELVCPQDAIVLHPSECGRWFISETRAGPMVHARLHPGRENSGKLVSLVKTQAQKLAEAHKKGLIIIDGPPGIGCPVIASIAGVDLALIVAEPTISGFSDLERAAQLTRHFGIKTAMIINKFDINEEIAAEIAKLCHKLNIATVGQIPYSLEFVQAQLAGKSIIEYTQGHIAETIRKTWENISEIVYHN